MKDLFKNFTAGQPKKDPKIIKFGLKCLNWILLNRKKNTRHKVKVAKRYNKRNPKIILCHLLFYFISLFPAGIRDDTKQVVIYKFGLSIHGKLKWNLNMKIDILARIILVLLSLYSVFSVFCSQIDHTASPKLLLEN